MRRSILDLELLQRLNDISGLSQLHGDFNNKRQGELCFTD